MKKTSSIYIAGHNGLVGSAIVRELNRQGYTNITTQTKKELDLSDQNAVREFFAAKHPEYVFLAAAKVGGILANSTRPADFIFQNLSIQNNVIHAAYESSVKKLLFLGSSCIYPRDCPQPIKEEYLLTGPLEETNKAYAVAKIAGIVLCQSYNKQHGTRFISAMPTNLYGPGDNFNLTSSHVLPALLRKFHEAKVRKSSHVTLWGTGTPRREFLHVDDLAAACVFLMEKYEESNPINIGTGEDISILELAEMIRDIVGFDGEIRLDTTKPNGTQRKLLNIEKIQSMGWRHLIGLHNGIETTYQWFVENSRND